MPCPPFRCQEARTRRHWRHHAVCAKTAIASIGDHGSHSMPCAPCQPLPTPWMLCRLTSMVCRNMHGSGQQRFLIKQSRSWPPDWMPAHQSWPALAAKTRSASVPLHSKTGADDMFQIRQAARTRGRLTSSLVRGTIWMSGRSSEAEIRVCWKRKRA